MRVYTLFAAMCLAAVLAQMLTGCADAAKQGSRQADASYLYGNIEASMTNIISIHSTLTSYEIDDELRGRLEHILTMNLVSLLKSDEALRVGDLPVPYRQAHGLLLANSLSLLEAVHGYESQVAVREPSVQQFIDSRWTAIQKAAAQEGD